jgi:glycosyltransferase involved in cell wall biosynthesis
MSVSKWWKKPPSASFFENQARFVGARKSVKLSVITQFFPPDYAATGQLIEELTRQLGQQGVDVEVFTGQPGYAFNSANAPAYEHKENVKIKRSRSAQLYSQQIRGKALNGVLFSIRAGLHLIRACQRRNVILLTTAPPFLPVLGYLAHVLFGVSYVCLLYDLYPDIAVELGVVSKNHVLARFWRAVNRQVWRRSQGIIVLSPAMKERIINHCPEVGDRISVIHSWADPDQVVPIPKAENWFAQEHGLVDRFTVLYSGNMGRCHDVDTILEAAKQLKDEPIQFVCIGGGAKRKGLIEQIKKLELNNFLFLPYQDKQDLPYSLTACDLSLVSVSPGMDDLVAPSKLYPALSTGRPIAAICSKQSYLNPLIAEASCGATFENGDSDGLVKFIRFLSRDGEQAERLGRSGRQYLLKHFTPKVIARQYFKALQQAIL